MKPYPNFQFVITANKVQRPDLKPTADLNSQMIIDDSYNVPSVTNLTQEDILRKISKKRLNMPAGQLIEFPPLNCRADLGAWVARVEEDLMAKDVMIPRRQWTDAAMIYLPEPLNRLMRQQRARRMEAGGEDTWIWEDFQASLSQALEKRDSESRCGIQNSREDHPFATTAMTLAGAGLVTVGSMVLAPAIMVGSLNAIGFTASGVARASIAAGIQSAVYGGSTTGLFSTCQSIWATWQWAVGSSYAIVSGIASVVAGIAILAVAQKNTKATGDLASEREGNTESECTSPPLYH